MGGTDIEREGGRKEGRRERGKEGEAVNGRNNEKQNIWRNGHELCTYIIHTQDK